MIDEVLAAYGFAGAASVEPVRVGLINLTYLIRDAGEPVAVAQRLHPVFGPEVNLDIDVVTAHLLARGLITPRLVRTAAGDPWLTTDDGTWRVLTYVAGETIEAIDGPDRAAAAGELVGRFHRALDGFEHEYAHRRANVHDTAAHLETLRGHALAAAAEPLEAQELGAEILAAATSLPGPVALPRRHCHGDLKISNVLFAPEDPHRAVCLVDLDTLGLQTIAYELGDALRSWCNPRGEDVADAELDLEILEASLRGYAAGAAGLLAPAEVESIAGGVATVCLELAARFCIDAFEDTYFGWDPSRFESRRAHNLVRAWGQLSLARSLLRNEDAARRIVRAAFE